MEPHVSEPIAKGTRPAATADADPLDEPPLQASGPHGEMPGPVKEAWGWRYPMPPASSTIASLTQRTAPASSRRRITAASLSKVWARRGAAPQVVGTPSPVARRSLAP